MKVPIIGTFSISASFGSWLRNGKKKTRSPTSKFSRFVPWINRSNRPYQWIKQNILGFDFDFQINTICQFSKIEIFFSSELLTFILKGSLIDVLI